jgi:hypothetical protein
MSRPAWRLFAAFAAADIITGGLVGVLRFRGAIEAAPFGAFVNLHLIVLMSAAVLVLLRTDSNRPLLGLTICLLLGDVGFAYAEWSGQHHGLVAKSAEVLWVPLRLGILLLALSWARLGQAQPARQRLLTGAAAIVLVPLVLNATLPLFAAGNTLSAAVAALTAPALLAIVWAWPTLGPTKPMRPKWALVGLGLYLATEFLRYGLEAAGVGDRLALFEVGYFAAYLAILAAAFSPEWNPRNTTERR